MLWKETLKTQFIGQYVHDQRASPRHKVATSRHFCLPPTRKLSIRELTGESKLLAKHAWEGIEFDAKCWRWLTVDSLTVSKTDSCRFFALNVTTSAAPFWKRRYKLWAFFAMEAEWHLSQERRKMRTDKKDRYRGREMSVRSHKVYSLKTFIAMGRLGERKTIWKARKEL